MLPEGFKKRISYQKYIDQEALLKALAEPSPVSIRVNPSKWNKIPSDSVPVPWSKNGYYLKTRPSYTLDPLFHSGCYYPQEASSMFLEKVVMQVTGSLKNYCVLDLCGAPGGKSTHLSELIGPDNLLVANDVIRARSVILSETLTKWGASNAIVTQNDPSAFGRLQGYFDIILVDAPCSGEGMFRSDVAVNEWSVENAAHCSERQKRILMDVWPSLKENGILIYSTCTFNPGENEENIKWLIDKQEAECVRISLDGSTGVTEIDYHGIYGYGFYPDRIRGEGFFISAIRKTGKQEKNHVKIHLMSELKPAKPDIEVVTRWTVFPKERILKWGDEVSAVPCDMNNYVYLFQNLKVVKPGTRIFTVRKSNFLPSHELVLSGKLKKEAFPGEEILLPEAISYLRRDTILIKNGLKGWNVVTYRGVNLGFINNLGNRVNNYFPVEWRIRLDSSALAKVKAILWEQGSFNQYST
jgi:16S rRNA C967 or C1407 C5-methylase (RsmB/RsmF family)/NOL1/NOP2/fmu family ribosome biogenesis protein